MTSSKTTILQYLDHFIANAKFRSISGGRIGLSVRAVANYTNFRIVFKDFETFLSGTIYFTELNKTNVDAFKHWLLIERNYSDNHAGRLMGTLKSICVDAKKNDIEVHHYINLRFWLCTIQARQAYKHAQFLRSYKNRKRTIAQ